MGTSAAGSAVAAVHAGAFLGREFACLFGELQPFLRRLDGLDLALGVLFQLGQHERAEFVGETDAGAVLAGASGAADAVHVVVGLFGQVVVHDVADAVYVDAARGDVGGNEDARFALAESVEDLQAFFLRHVAGQEFSVLAVLEEAGGDGDVLVLAVAEDDHALGLLLADHVQEHPARRRTAGR